MEREIDNALFKQTFFLFIFKLFQLFFRLIVNETKRTYLILRNLLSLQLINYSIRLNRIVRHIIFAGKNCLAREIFLTRK